MIEKVLFDHMRAALAPTPIYMAIPADPPAKFVYMEKTGSGESNRLKNSTFAFQSYGATLFEAASLNEEVKQAAQSAVTLPEITRAALNTDYNFADTARKRHRYQAVFDFWHY